jgi:hypothetical protein
VKLLTIKKMKKILGTLVLFLAFTLNASAQDKAFKKVDAAVEAKKNVTEMAEYLRLNSEDVENFLRLFEHKFRLLNENISDERKTELARIIDLKIRATLTPAQMEKLDKNPELLKKLTH